LILLRIKNVYFPAETVYNVIMSMITTHTISACRFDYEFLGKDTSTLALAYGFREEDLQAEIEIQSWERKLEPTVLPDTKDIRVFAEALESTTRSKLSIISLFRQIDNQPMIAELEKAFLKKALELTTELRAVDDRAATKLVNLVKAVSLIQERNPIDLADTLKESLKTSSGQVVVNIANQLN